MTWTNPCIVVIGDFNNKKQQFQEQCQHHKMKILETPNTWSRTQRLADGGIRELSSNPDVIAGMKDD